jgi:hypothetical protein
MNKYLKLTLVFLLLGGYGIVSVVAMDGSSLGLQLSITQELQIKINDIDLEIQNLSQIIKMDGLSLNMERHLINHNLPVLNASGKPIIFNNSPLNSEELKNKCKERLLTMQELNRIYGQVMKVNGLSLNNYRMLVNAKQKVIYTMLSNDLIQFRNCIPIKDFLINITALENAIAHKQVHTSKSDAAAIIPMHIKYNKLDKTLLFSHKHDASIISVVSMNIFNSIKDNSNIFIEAQNGIEIIPMDVFQNPSVGNNIVLISAVLITLSIIIITGICMYKNTVINEETEVPKEETHPIESLKK